MATTKIKNAYNATEADIQPGAKFGYVIVAEVGHDNDWAAYRGPADWSPERVALHGQRISKEAAEDLFPIMKWVGLHYRT